MDDIFLFMCASAGHGFANRHDSAQLSKQIAGLGVCACGTIPAMPKALLKLVVCSLTIMHASAIAQVVDPQNVLIRNVRLLDAGSETESAIVHLLIKDNKLDLVSKEVFPTPEGVIAIDAENGFLFGKLKINETPSFIILNEDPGENFDVLLDTEAHAVFAVHEGELRKNNLFEVIAGVLIED